jgi:hypothetical protein
MSYRVSIRKLALRPTSGLMNKDAPYRGLFRASGAFSRNQFSVDYSIQ